MPLHDWRDDRGWDSVHLVWLAQLLDWVQPCLPAGFRACLGSVPALTVDVPACHPDLSVREWTSSPTEGSGAEAVSAAEPDTEAVAAFALDPQHAVHIDLHGRLITLAGIGAILLSAGLLLTGAGCSSSANTPADTRPFAGQGLNVFNWSDYIDPDLLREFEERTGARIQYDNYSSEAELEAKLLAGGGGYDVIFPSDRSMPPLVKKNLLGEINRELLPNWRNLDPKFLGARYDPQNRYSVPYFWGTVAIGIRTDHVKEPVKDFSVLFDPRYKNRITMLEDPENVVAAVLLYLGLPMNSTEDADLARVKEVLIQQRPLVQAYTSSQFREKLIKGEAWVVLGWNGDILQARKEQPAIQAIVPSSGTLIWVDSVAVPRTARNLPLAHAFIDYLLEPDVAARNANFVQYASPNLAAREKIDPDLLADPAVYPSPQVLDRCQWLLERGPAIAKIEKIWQEVRK